MTHIRATTFVPLAALITGLVLTAAVFAQDMLTPDQAFEARKDQMQTFGKTLRTLRSLTPDQLTDTADVFVAGFDKLPDLFPEGSNVAGSHALPIIWEQWDDVMAIIEKGRGAAAHLHDVAGTGDVAAFQTAARDMLGVCNQCHDTYRAEEH